MAPSSATFYPRLNPSSESAMTVDPTLQRNIDAFCAQLDSLLAEHAGKYVVYADSRLIQVCDSLESAFSLGYGRFGAGDFLVQRIEPLRDQIDFHAACRV